MPTLSLLTVTRAEPHAWPFLWALVDLARELAAEGVIAADGADAEARLREAMPPIVGIVRVDSAGYIETVLDQAVEACTGDYVLRLDDDERCSPALVAWLKAGGFMAADHWKFARAHLWQSHRRFISSLPLWPDHQTRLSVRAKAGGRRSIHAGSPFGGGELAPAVIEHHKFLVRPREERRAIAARYDRVAPGAGSGGMLAFQLPEEALGQFLLAPLGDGDLVTIERAPCEAVEVAS